jgi:DNA polymerase III subunit gamma/tau
MPTPGEALKQLGYGGGGVAPAASSPPASAPRGPVAVSAPAPRASGAATAARPAATPAPASPGVAIASFEALVALAESKRDIRLKIALESEVRLVRFEQGRIEFELAPGGARDLASTLTQRLQLWTSERWMVSVVASGGAPTLKEQRETKERERRSGLEADPVVASVLAHFPGAQIIAVRGKDEPARPAPDALEAPDVQYDDMSPFDED